MLHAENKKPVLWVMMVLLVITALILTGYENAAAQNAGPKAVVSEPEKDAGEISSDKKLIHDFIIRNDGDAPLLIIDVKAACGCTAHNYDKTIAPGKTGKIHTVTDVSTFKGFISKGITVSTNDPANPLIQLTVKGKVMAALD